MKLARLVPALITILAASATAVPVNVSDRKVLNNLIVPAGARLTECSAASRNSTRLEMMCAKHNGDFADFQEALAYWMRRTPAVTAKGDWVNTPAVSTIGLTIGRHAFVLSYDHSARARGLILVMRPL